LEALEPRILLSSAPVATGSAANGLPLPGSNPDAPASITFTAGSYVTAEAPSVVDPIEDVLIIDYVPKTLQVFLLAGQSNMVGYGHVAGLPDYDPGLEGGAAVASIEWLTMADPNAADGTHAKHAQNYLDSLPAAYFTFDDYIDASWANARDDVWAHHVQSTNGAPSQVKPISGITYYGPAPLEPGFGATSGHPLFGPELGLGIHLGEDLQQPIFLYKSDTGGTTLAVNWRPPTAAAERGGVTGPHFTQTMSSFTSFLDQLDADLADDGLLNGYGDAEAYEVAGFVWFQGWNEQYNDDHIAEYSRNLVDLIHDIRAADSRIPDDLGMIIGESSDQNGPLNVQRAAATATLNAEIPNSAAFFYTSNMVNSNYNNDTYGFYNVQGYHFNWKAENYLEIGWKMGQAALDKDFVEDDFGTTIDLSGVFANSVGDPGPLTLTLAGNTNPGLVTPELDGDRLVLIYTPGAFGEAWITVRATDSAGISVDEAFKVTVIDESIPRPVEPVDDVWVHNNAPDTVIDISEVFEDAEDPVEAMTLTVESNTAPAVVAAAIVGTDVILSYPPDAPGTAEITIRATDTDGNYGEDTFTVHVNHDPVANDDVLHTDEDRPLWFGVNAKLLLNDTDDDGDPLSLESFTQPSHGEVVDNGNGTLTYTPDLGYIGNDEFTYTAGDGRGGTDEATVTLIVDEVLPPPPPTVVQVVANNQPGYGISSVIAVSFGVWSIAVSFSERAIFTAGDVALQTVTFPGGVETLGETITPSSVSGSATYQMMIRLPLGPATRGTWVKVVLDGDGIRTAAGITLDGDAPDDGSGRGYLFDTATDLPSGDGTAGGDAVFYIGSLPADATGDGRIGDDDLAVLLGNWETGSAVNSPSSRGDFTLDTDVDDDDLAVLLANWGSALDDLPAPVAASESIFAFAATLEPAEPILAPAVSAPTPAAATVTVEAPTAVATVEPAEPVRATRARRRRRRPYGPADRPARPTESGQGPLDRIFRNFQVNPLQQWWQR